MTDAGFDDRSVLVSSTPVNEFTVDYTLLGVVSAGFGMFGGPSYSASFFGLVNFTATVDGQYLDVDPNNGPIDCPGFCASGFFVDVADSAAYYAVGGAISPGGGIPPGDVLTIGYGTDDPFSPCYGGQVPEHGGSHCVVTGVFEDADAPVPEPGALPIFLASLGIFGTVISLQRRRASSGGQSPQRLPSRNRQPSRHLHLPLRNRMSVSVRCRMRGLNPRPSVYQTP